MHGGVGNAKRPLRTTHPDRIRPRRRCHSESFLGVLGVVPMPPADFRPAVIHDARGNGTVQCSPATCRPVPRSSGSRHPSIFTTSSLVGPLRAADYPYSWGPKENSGAAEAPKI